MECHYVVLRTIAEIFEGASECLGKEVAKKRIYYLTNTLSVGVGDVLNDKDLNLVKKTHFLGTPEEIKERERTVWNGSAGRGYTKSYKN